jgi:hypothetical protein
MTGVTAWLLMNVLAVPPAPRVMGLADLQKQALQCLWFFLQHQWLQVYSMALHHLQTV